MVGAGISSDPSFERIAHGTQQATQKTRTKTSAFEGQRASA
jgi:hypothetical protein